MSNLFEEQMFILTGEQLMSLFEEDLEYETDPIEQTASPNGLVSGLRRPDHLTDGLDKSYQIICDLDLNSENLEQTLLPHVTWILVVEKEVRCKLRRGNMY